MLYPGPVLPCVSEPWGCVLAGVIILATVRLCVIIVLRVALATVGFAGEDCLVCCYFVFLGILSDFLWGGTGVPTAASSWDFGGICLELSVPVVVRAAVRLILLVVVGERA